MWAPAENKIILRTKFIEGDFCFYAILLCCHVLSILYFCDLIEGHVNLEDVFLIYLFSLQSMIYQNLKQLLKKL